MLFLLLIAAGLIITARVFWVAGYKTAARHAADIARMARVDMVRADTPLYYPPGCDEDCPGHDLAEYFGGPVGDEPERLQAKLRAVEECSVCGEPGCPDHM